MEAALEELALREIARKADERGKMTPEQIQQLGPSVAPPPTDAQPLGLWLAFWYPKHTLARLQAMQGELSDNPERSALRKMHFRLKELAGCTQGEIEAYLGYESDSKRAVELDTDLDRASKQVFAFARESAGVEE
jgi:hypothetical protein